MIGSDPREKEVKAIEAHIASTGSLGLVEGLFYRDRAIRKVLANKDDPEHQALKRSLAGILTGEDQTFDLQKRSVACSIDSIPPSVDHGFLPAAIKASAGMDQQIAAINFLAPLARNDDSLYDLLFKIARGDTSNITNVHEAATKALSYQVFSRRRVDLRRVANNPMRKEKDRILAYKIMAGAALFTDPLVYESICDLGFDTTIAHLYDARNTLAPSARASYEFEWSRRNNTLSPSHGKSKGEVKVMAVTEAQQRFQEELFTVIDYVLETAHKTQMHNDVGAMNGLRDGFPQTSQKLTRTLCQLVSKKPSYHVQTLCRYAQEMVNISREEAEHMVQTLEDVKGKQGTSTAKDWMDTTLNTLSFRLGKERDGYWKRTHLTQIWTGEYTAQQIVSWRK